MATGDSLSIVNATKFYKNFKAVDEVSFTVHHSEFLTILGPSGSGKTSLLKLIAGFEELSSGSILLNNEDVTSKKAYEREIGMLFQNYALFPHMSVFDNIAYPLRLRKVSKRELQERVHQILTLVRLDEYGSRFPKQLSGGQQQRVALARAIVFNPPLLLLDEPLGALDKNLRQQMQLEIKRIQQTIGITTISVTHDQEEALTMSNRICVMNSGRIEQIDTPENLYKRPVNRFVAEFIGAINLIKGDVLSIENGCIKVRIFDEFIVLINMEERPRVMENNTVLIAIRPENLQIAAEQSRFDNTFRSKVLETIYVGDAVKVKVQTTSGQEILVKVPAHMSNSLACGADIRLGWNSTDATLLSDEPKT